MDSNHTIQSSGYLPVLGEKFSDTSKNLWDYSEGYLDGQVLEAVGNSGIFTNQRWLAGPCLFAQRAVDASVFQHDKKHIAMSGNILSCQRYVQGHNLGTSGDIPFRCTLGTIAIIDLARPLIGVQSANICQTVFIPHEAIGFYPGHYPSSISFETGSTMARVINAELDLCFNLFLQGEKQISEQRVTRLLSCLQVAFTKGETHSDIRAEAREALGDVIKKYIEEHLIDPNLTTMSLLREFAVSRATLYRIFEPYGGVRAYIAERKLFNAVVQISRNPTRRGSMTEIAEAWGYASYQTFHRAVRRSFGVSPNSLFQSPVGAFEHGESDNVIRLPKNNKWVAGAGKAS